jgi:hypothetical protein
MIYSGLEKKPVEMPLDGTVYESMIKEKIATSTYVKPEVVRAEVASLEGSY